MLLFAACLALVAGCSYTYTVRPGDTIYSIASKYDVDQDTLMQNNDISDPTTLPVGKRLKIPRIENGSNGNQKAMPNNHSSTQTSDKGNGTGTETTQSAIDKIKTQKTPTAISKSKMDFIWPVKGVVVRPYGKDSEGRINDGIKIGAPEGAKIVAASDGEVIFSSDTFPAYGNLIVIKHKNNMATLYAHNRVNLVAKGVKVVKGQQIAEVGSTGRVTTPAMHFEVRVGSNPVDPMNYLPPLHF